MNVQSSTRRKAVLEIYQAHRRPRGGSLSVRELERDWRETGLRRSDLDLALKDMTLHQLLALRRTHDGVHYELTYLGERALQLPLAGGAINLLRDWLTLRRAQRRARRPPPADRPRNRRADDDVAGKLPLPQGQLLGR